MDSLLKEVASLGNREKGLNIWAPILLSVTCGGILTSIFELIKNSNETLCWILLVIFIILSFLLYIKLRDNMRNEQGSITKLKDRIQEVVLCSEDYYNSINQDYLNPDDTLNWDKVYKDCVLNNSGLHSSHLPRITSIIICIFIPSIAIAIPINQSHNFDNHLPEIALILSSLTAIITIYISLRLLKKEKKSEENYKELSVRLHRQELLLNEYEGLLKKHTALYVSKKHANHKELFDKGRALLQSGNTESAIELFNSAIVLNPTNYLYYESRADAFDQMGNEKQALEDYDRAIELSNKENSIRIIHKKAIIQNYLGNIIEAELNYAKAHKTLMNLDETTEKSIDAKEIINLLNDYGNLLLQLNKMSLAEDIFSTAANKCNSLNKNSNDYQELVAMTQINYALLHKKQYKFVKAKEEVLNALQIYRLLAQESPKDYLPDVALALNNLGNIYQGTREYKKALEMYSEAINIRRGLAEQNPDLYLSSLADSINNKADLLLDINDYSTAETNYHEALAIRRQLAESNPDAYLPDVATTLNNLANLHSDTNQLDKAGEEYNEALSIRRQMADKNPNAFLPNVAQTLNNLAILHFSTNQYKEAKEEYNEALTTYRQLAAKNPDAYLPYVANTLNNLANLHYNTKRNMEAEEEYNEALNTYRQLADKNPDAYLPDVAMALNNLGEVYRITNQLDIAEKEYNEALTIRRQLANMNPVAYMPKIANTLYNIASLYLYKNDLPAAEAAAQESLEKYRIMANMSHAAFDKDMKDAEELLERIRKAKEADA